MQQPTPITTPAATLPADRTPQDVAALLRRPFAPGVIRSRKIGGRDTPYIAIGDVVERLNRACLEWQWEVTRIEVITMPIIRKGETVMLPVAHVTGSLSIPGLGSRQGIGTAVLEGSEDATKSAASDALKRAGSLFGIPTN